VAAVVGRSLGLLDHHPAFARIRVTSRIPAGLPPVHIDPDSLKQIVLALAINAARAMAGGGTLSLRASARPAQIVLEMSDTGTGVPAALRGQIFKPYFTTDPTSGNGLGLPIARSLARAAGGDLVYRPGRRRGACFQLMLSAPTLAPSPGRRRKAANPTQRRPRRRGRR
jgi:signal transduction histidine kinase